MGFCGEIAGVFSSLFKSMFTFPSCVFWISSVFPIFGFLFGYLMNAVDENFSHGYVLTTSFVLISPYKMVLVLSRLGKLIAFIRISFMIQRYYNKVSRNAAPAAKSLISIYLKREIFFSILIVLTECGFIFINPIVYPTAHYASVLSYFVSNIFFNTNLMLLNRVKNGELFPIGCGIDTATIGLTVIGFPLHVRELMNGNYTSWMYNISAFLMQVIHLLIDIKFIFAGMVILGYRFIRFQDDSLP